MTPPGRGARPRRSPSVRGPASNQRRALVRAKTAGTLPRSLAYRHSRREQAQLRPAAILVYFAACSNAWRPPIKMIRALGSTILQPTLEPENEHGIRPLSLCPDELRGTSRRCGAAHSRKTARRAAEG